jgi:CRISPR-associated protein Cmr3
VKRLAMAVWTDAAKIIHGLAPLGGERRLVTWRDGKNAAINLLESPCPKAIDDCIKQSKHCRVVLLTPAHFKHGFRPTWLCEPREGVTAELQAAAIGRAQVVSGWDFEKGTPKPTRRLAPTGSVFFLKLNGDADAIARWIKATWMRCISDDTEEDDKARDRRDGFGLAALGVWDGIFREME